MEGQPAAMSEAIPDTARWVRAAKRQPWHQIAALHPWEKRPTGSSHLTVGTTTCGMSVFAGDHFAGAPGERLCSRCSRMGATP